MKELIKKLIRLETDVTTEKGPFDLFGLFSSDDDEDERWDLVVSATWIGEQSLQALRFLTKQLRSYLAPAEFSRILKIAPLDVYDPRVTEIQKIVSTEHKVKELSDYRFYGFRVEKIYIITCKPQVDENLMRLMWKIILRKWHVGEGMIKSEAVLTELEKRGTKVRDYSMDRVFEYLLREGCITGAQYIDSDGIRKHGAMSIGWVNDSYRVPDSIQMSA
jgi:hypothetical protein